MTELLSPAIIDELMGFHRLIVGFSGGLDSTVLLHALSQVPALKSRVLAVHINHQISPYAKDWATHAKAKCDKLAIAYQMMMPSFDKSHNLEAHAREARYQALTSLAGASDVILTAHHQNDQAETLLLRLCRGSGIDGLKAMSMRATVNNKTLFRPLLHLSRLTLEAYASAHELTYIHDESNDNTLFSRNFIRHRVLPLLETQWPAVVDVLSRTSALMGEGQDNLNDLAAIDLKNHPKDELDIKKLLLLSPARQRNALRYFLKMHGCILSATQLQTLQDDMLISKEDANPCFRIGNIEIRRYQYRLSIVKPHTNQPKSVLWAHFPAPLICDFGRFEVQGTPDSVETYVGKTIEIRFRQGGERLKAGKQHRSLKKWMQEKKIPPWQRDKIPLLFVDDELVLIIGYGSNDGFLVSFIPKCSYMGFMINPVCEKQ